MSTRITGGSERGRKVRATRGAGLRPTAERVRSAIFSMIGRSAVEGGHVLDLYAGTGALGIEALSRGASWAEFVEVHPGRCQDIRDSLRQLGLVGRGHVGCARVEGVLHRLEDTFDLVLIDPPYTLDPWDLLMDRLTSGHLLKESALVVAEHQHRRQLEESYGRLLRVKSRRHGDTSISIYRAGENDG